jgi:RNA polymerase sigma-54 factor
MQQIADRVGVHVTTISRAVDDKWISTPRGIYPLKRFFTGGTTTAAGDELAWDTVKQKLLDLISKEDKSNPLSDEHIMDSFKADGITIARRTVTKYREAMHIPSSRQRKSY